MQTKRIAFVAPFGLGKKATVWARTLPLARNLVRQGHEVSVLIPPWDTPGDAGRTWDDAGVEVAHVGLGRGPVAVAARLVRAIQAREPEIVHIVKPRAYAGMVQWWLWQLRRVKGDAASVPARIVLDIDDWEQAWAPVNGYPPLLARALAWQEEWGIRHADAITAASRWLENRAAEYAPHTPRLYLPNGIESAASAHLTEEAAAQDNQSTKVQTLLFFSRYIEVDAGWLAAFWDKMQVVAPGTRLLVVGEAVQPEIGTAFRAEVARLAGPQTESIEWRGYVPPSELAGIYAATDCAIFPAKNSILMQAKCSAKLAGTLLAGLPVVASAVGEQANYGAEGAARLVPAAASPAQFAQGVADVLTDPETRRSLAERARGRLTSTYDWSHLATSLSEFYARVCSSKESRIEDM